MAQPINLDHWPRKQHFEAFMQMERPQFSASFSINVSSLSGRKDIKLFPALLYCITHAAQTVPEFRNRITPSGQVVELESGWFNFSLG